MWFNMCIYIYIMYPCSIMFVYSCAIYWRDTAPCCNSAMATRHGYNHMLSIHSLLFLSTTVRAMRRHQAKPQGQSRVCVYIYIMYPFIVIRIYSCTIYSGDAVSSDKCTRAIICICKYTYIYIYIYIIYIYIYIYIYTYYIYTYIYMNVYLPIYVYIYILHRVSQLCDLFIYLCIQFLVLYLLQLYDLFGRYGAIRQIRKGNTKETRGTAFVVYEDIYDAKNVCSFFLVRSRWVSILVLRASFFRCTTLVVYEDIYGQICNFFCGHVLLSIKFISRESFLWLAQALLFRHQDFYYHAKKVYFIFWGHVASRTNFVVFESCLRPAKLG